MRALFSPEILQAAAVKGLNLFTPDCKGVLLLCPSSSSGLAELVFWSVLQQ